MNKTILSLIVCLISLIISAVATVIIRKRIVQIQDLPDTVIEEKERNNYVNTLTQKCYFTIIATVLNIINIFLPDSPLKFIVPALGIVICCYFLVGIMDEIDIFNVKKDDADVFQERIKEKEEELRLQKEIIENARKHKNKK